MFNFIKKYPNIRRVYLKFRNPSIAEMLKNHTPSKPNTDLSLLYPPFLDIVKSLQKDLEDAGLDFHVFDALRSPERQLWLWNQGRGTPGTIVTNALPGESFHNFGIAVDLVVDKYPHRHGIHWTWDSPQYAEMERIIKEKYPTLVHGASWRLRDYPHIQLKIPCRLSVLRKIFNNHGGGERGLLAVYSHLDKLL